MTVGRICRRDVVTASEHESAAEVARRMSIYNVGSIVVLDANKQPISVVTDRDLVLSILATGTDPETQIAESLFRDNARIIFEESAIEDALRLMRAAGCRRLPVVNEERKLVGIIALDDILALLAEEFTTIGALLKQQTDLKSA